VSPRFGARLVATAAADVRRSAAAKIARQTSDEERW
jgi:hypothetical protein